jgi:hypothetical protein
MVGTHRDNLLLWVRRRALDDEPVARMHTNQNSVRCSQVYRRLGMRDATWHHANLATAKPESFTWALEIGGSTSLNKQFRSSVEERASLTLKTAGLLGEADSQLTDPKRRERSFQISRNRQHRSDFYY